MIQWILNYFHRTRVCGYPGHVRGCACQNPRAALGAVILAAKPVLAAFNNGEGHVTSDQLLDLEITIERAEVFTHG